MDIIGPQIRRRGRCSGALMIEFDPPLLVREGHKNVIKEEGRKELDSLSASFEVFLLIGYDLGFLIFSCFFVCVVELFFFWGGSGFRPSAFVC